MNAADQETLTRPDQRLVLAAEACPHRDASLGLARVEARCLRLPTPVPSDLA
ncbi:MAG: hypothetical protein JNJ59_05535 [Deltaproteobacteria bacterium]|nr:hypothetical protein [Deltaproteobacteria bacterium]